MTDKLKSHNFEVVIKNGIEDNEEVMNGELGGIDDREQGGIEWKLKGVVKRNIIGVVLWQKNDAKSTWRRI